MVSFPYYSHTISLRDSYGSSMGMRSHYWGIPENPTPVKFVLRGGEDDHSQAVHGRMLPKALFDLGPSVAVA